MARMTLAQGGRVLQARDVTVSRRVAVGNSVRIGV